MMARRVEIFDRDSAVHLNPFRLKVWAIKLPLSNNWLSSNRAWWEFESTFCDYRKTRDKSTPTLVLRRDFHERDNFHFGGEKSSNVSVGELHLSQLEQEWFAAFAARRMTQTIAGALE
jgi:hypothetical protein